MARRELVARIVASRSFRKADRLSSFLLHICELTLQGRSSEISEYQIGRAVFGRPENYEPAIDGIVRAHASRLRARLDQYFAREGRDEPIRLRIPRGAYLPVFERKIGHPVSAEERTSAQEFSSLSTRASSLDADLISPSESSASKAENFKGKETLLEDRAPDSKQADRRRSFGSIAFAWSVILILSVIIVVLLFKKTEVAAKINTAQSPPNPLWSQMFTNDPTMVVPGDSSLVIWQDLMDKNIGLAEYLGAGYRAQTPPPGATLLQRELVDVASRRYTSIVDLEVVETFSQIARMQRGTLDVRYARDVRPNDLKQGNIVLIGTSETNPWVQLFQHDMNFAFYKDRAAQTYTIFNRDPQGNEPRQWDYRRDDPQHRVYGVVAYLPNLSGQGNVLILEGTDMAGTECARDFVADDLQLRPFLRRIQRADGVLPHFEVVLMTNNINGSAVKNRILAWRTIPS